MQAVLFSAAVADVYVYPFQDASDRRRSSQQPSSERRRP